MIQTAINTLNLRNQKSNKIFTWLCEQVIIYLLYTSNRSVDLILLNINYDDVYLKKILNRRF